MERGAQRTQSPCKLGTLAVTVRGRLNRLTALRADSPRALSARLSIRQTQQRRDKLHAKILISLSDSLSITPGPG